MTGRPPWRCPSPRRPVPRAHASAPSLVRADRRGRAGSTAPQPVGGRVEGAHCDDLAPARRGASRRVLQRDGRVLGAVVPDDESRRLTRLGSRVEATLALHGPAGNAEHGAVRLVQQRVRSAAERGAPEAPEAARPQNDLVRLELARQLDERAGRRRRPQARAPPRAGLRPASAAARTARQPEPTPSRQSPRRWSRRQGARCASSLRAPASTSVGSRMTLACARPGLRRVNSWAVRRASARRSRGSRPGR